MKCVDGTLELKGTYQVHGKEDKYHVHLLSGCQRVIAQDAKLELFAPLVFDSTSLEFEGHLTVVAKAPMAGSCLRFAGQVVISGDFFVKDCQNQLMQTKELDDDMDTQFFWDDPEDREDVFANGGGIHALNLILQKSGKITIENCSSKGHGGAIYVEDFNQVGGEMMIQNCRADRQGGAIYSKNNFRQDGGDLTIQNCAVSHNGGAIYVFDSFTQEGGEMMIQHISLSNCKAERHGGGLWTKEFEQIGGGMRIQSCEAKRIGGGLATLGKIFHQDGELHVRKCRAPHGGAAFVESAVVEQGTSAAALVEARQLEEKCLSQISGPHTQVAAHKHTELPCTLEKATHCNGNVVDRPSSRFYRIAAATPTDCWTFIPAHTHWRPFLVYDVEFCF